MLKAVIFDLDQTSVDRTATFQRFLEKQYRHFQDDLGAVPKDRFISTIQYYDANGYTPKKEVYAQTCEVWELELGSKLLANFEETY